MFHENGRRAFRRRQSELAKARARRVVRHCWSVARDKDIERLATRLADNLCSCSCPGCGNPRHFGQGSSHQERRQAGNCDD